MSAGGNVWWILPLLLAVYSISAWNMIILDCDETFNYLEPLHFLIYGKGFQTWEYAPQFALRPYSFLLLFSKPITLLTSILSIKNKVNVYKMIRLTMGILSAWTQSRLLATVSRHFGMGIAKYSTIIMALSSGMFISSTAFLPNTFSMSLLCLIWSYWLQGKDARVLLLTALMIVLGWPYAALCAVIPCLFSLKESYPSADGKRVAALELPARVRFNLLVRRLITSSMFSLIYIVFPSLIIETKFYGRITLPFANALLYNILASKGGPNIFGTEPWHFYAFNLLLNFNVFLPLSLLAPGFAHFYKSREKMLYLWSCLAFPLAVFTLQAHKEERFLFVLYPLICINAAIVINSFKSIKTVGKILAFGAILVGGLLGLSRSLAVIRFYSGQQTIFDALPSDNQPYTICMGNDWFRFPTSFYLPENSKLGFIRSDFNGQLPIYFASTDSTAKGVNNLNEPTPNQFINISECSYIIGERVTSEDQAVMKKSMCKHIVNLDKTKAPFKWIWVSDRFVSWKEYCLFTNKQ